jgi:hypothetical protein
MSTQIKNRSKTATSPTLKHKVNKNKKIKIIDKVNHE